MAVDVQRGDRVVGLDDATVRQHGPVLLFLLCCWARGCARAERLLLTRHCSGGS
jgi:hypothetical protein